MTGNLMQPEPLKLFEDVRTRVFERLLCSASDAEEALATGGLVLNGRTVVLRLSAKQDSLEVFSDIGLPAAGAEPAVCRAAMEMNLCRTHEPMIFGIHPNSGRLVALCVIPMLALCDDDLCISLLNGLSSKAAELRESRVFDLAIEE